MAAVQNSPEHSSPLIEARNLSRIYGDKNTGVTALDNVSFSVEAGEAVAITGPSGCGKSTLLHLLGGLDCPDAGELRVDGVELHEIGEPKLTRFRREKIGVIFQFFHLLPTMTVLENTELPLLLKGMPPRETRKPATQLLERVGLGGRLGHFPHQLSGGEMQRCAIARALVHRPAILLADEPTGNLDTPNAEGVLSLLRELHTAGGLTLLLVTHSSSVAGIASRNLVMCDGRLVEDR